MTTLTKKLMILLIPLFLVKNVSAQTIFPLDPTNIEETIMSIRSHMIAIPLPAPSIESLREFLSIPTRNRIYHNAPNSCSNPQIQVFPTANGFFFFFSGFQSPVLKPDLLYIQQMDSEGLKRTTSANYGPRGYNGFNLDFASATKRIFLVGSYCSNCSSPSYNYCVSNWEVIIIDKSIL